MIVHEAVGARVEQFRLPAAVELAVRRHDVRDVWACCRTELARRPQPRVFIDVLSFVQRFVSHARLRKYLRRELVALEVADVDDPDAIGAVLLRQAHLLPDLGDGARVDPLVAARAAVIIEVVVDAAPPGRLRSSAVGKRRTLPQLSSAQSSVTSSGTRRPFS